MTFNKWHQWLFLKIDCDMYISVFDIMQMLFDRDLNNKDFFELIRIIRENEKIRRDLSCFIQDKPQMEDKDV